VAHILLHALGLAALAAAVWLAGRVLLRPIVGVDLGAWQTAASFLVGSLYWMAALFALAAAGFLTRAGLVAAALPLAAAAVALRRGLAPPRTRPPARSRRGALDLVPGAVLAAVLGSNLLVTLAPVVSWDAAVYHLALPRLYLEHGGFRPVEMSVYSHWPQGVELLFAAAMLVQDWVLAKLVHFGFGLLVAAALFVAARRAGGAARRSAPWLAVALFLSNDVVAQELRVAYVDLAIAFFLLSGVVCMGRALDAPTRRHADAWLLLAGLAGGGMAAVKVTGIAGAAVVGALALPRLVASGRARRPGPRPGAFVARFAAPALLLWLPWPLESALATGNPVYPFLYGTFGGPDWSVELGRRFAGWQRSIGMGREPLDYLLLPFRVILAGGEGYERFDGRIGAFWILVVPLALVLARRRPAIGRPLAAAGLWFALWAATSQQMRLLLPILPLLALAGGVAVAELAARLGGRRACAAVLLAAGAFAVQVHAPAMAAGAKSAAVYVAFEGDLLATAVPAVHRFVGERLPAGAKLLFVNENRGFFCPREILADSFFEASQVRAWLGGARSPDEAARRLAARGVTHVLVARPALAPGVPPALAALLADPRRAERIYAERDGAVALYALLAAPGADG